MPTSRLTDKAIKKRVGNTEDILVGRFILRDGDMVPKDYGLHHTQIAWKFYPPKDPYSSANTLDKFIENTKAVRIAAWGSASEDTCKEVNVEMRSDLPVTDSQWRRIGELVRRCETTAFDIKTGGHLSKDTCDSGTTNRVSEVRNAYEGCQPLRGEELRRWNEALKPKVRR